MEERSFNYYNFPSSNTNTNTSNNFSTSNNIPYFAHQAIRAGYASPELMRREMYRNPSTNLDFRDSIQRELEKERIRAEILAQDILRRKVLEDEVRREMAMEREMAMWRGGGRGGGGGGSGVGSTMRFDHRVGVGVGVPLLTNFEHGVGGLPGREIGFCEPRMMPFQRDPGVAGNVDGSGSGSGRSVGVKLNEIKESKGNGDVMSKDKVVFVAKPNATDLKRKATTSLPVTPVDPSAASKKPKIKDELRCDLCQVTATSERALKDHLQGKKHKTRESGLNTHRTGFGTGPLPKFGSHSVAKPTKVPGASNSRSLEKVGKSASQESPSIQKSALMKEPETSVAKGKIGEASVHKSVITKPKKKFKYFCETCHVGAYSLKVMNAHNKGKRHLAKAVEPNKTYETSAQKIMVGKVKVSKEPGIANPLDKGVVEVEKKMDISVGNSSLEKGVDEEEKKMDTSVAISSLDKCVGEGEKKGTSAAYSSVEKDVDEEKKKDSSVTNSSLEKGVDEEEKKDISVANSYLEKGVDEEEEEKKDTSVANIFLEKGVDEEQKNNTSIANCSLQKCVDEEEKKNNTSFANCSLEKPEDEEKKGNDTSVASETNIEREEDSRM